MEKYEKIISDLVHQITELKIELADAQLKNIPVDNQICFNEKCECHNIKYDNNCSATEDNNEKCIYSQFKNTICDRYENINKVLLRTTNALNDSMELLDRYYKSIERKYKTIEKLRQDQDPQYLKALHTELEILRGIKDEYIEAKL